MGTGEIHSRKAILRIHTPLHDDKEAAWEPLPGVVSGEGTGSVNAGLPSLLQYRFIGFGSTN